MQEGMPIFKSKTMQEPGMKKRMWKSLKQIQTTERNLFGNASTAVIYSSINAPPSFKPPKKYSDMSGLLASYSCPQSKIYYHNSEEYKIVKKMPSDISKGYLTLRGATSLV
ncbi:INO80 complex subunit C [Chironomus tepperi]|uniref:INO80 complex subunit C n=1 Tax=Chironomus tepperi TaxID=113505 RepID=UPI00391F588E